jgi:hypothetical protein
MSKKTIEMEVVQCDYINEQGERCSHEADKDSMLTAGQTRNSYCFCVEHLDDLINLVIEKFGDKYEIPPNHYGGGVGETQVLQTHNQSLFNKNSSSK